MVKGICYCCAGSIENGAVLSGGRVYCSLECARSDQLVLAQLAREEARFARSATLERVPSLATRAPAVRLERQSATRASGPRAARAALTGSR